MAKANSLIAAFELSKRAFKKGLGSSPTPSRADILISKRLCQSGKLLGIEVLDHIIISKDNHTSMKEMDCQNQIGFSTYYDDA